MIRAILFIAAKLVYIIPILRRIPLYLGAIWSFIKMLSQHGATWLILSLYPIIELLIEAITGTRGPVSGAIQSLLNTIVNKFLNITFNVDLQSAINSLPQGLLKFCCYLGITGDLQFLMDGFITGAIVFVNLRLALIVIQIKLVALGGLSRR